MSGIKTKILLVEDDKSMGFLLVDFLESNGFEVKLYRDGKAGLNSFRETKYDFCILDVMLPGLDGFSIAEKIREENKEIPIVFVTARTMKADKIKGFNLGVDDYITKPFDEDELICRINAILTRSQRAQNENVAATIPEIFQIGIFTFDYSNQLLSTEDSSRRLTQKEGDVLRHLCQMKNNIVKRDDLLMAVWGNDNYFNGRSLDVFITKLRKYLSPDPNINIENIPKVGFVLNNNS